MNCRRETSMGASGSVARSKGKRCESMDQSATLTLLRQRRVTNGTSVIAVC
jgi:hypothetical protein